LTVLGAALLFLGVFAAAYVSDLVIEQRSLLRIVLIILVFFVPLSAIPFLYRLFDMWIPGLPPFVALQRSADVSAQARNLDRGLTNARSANQCERVAAVVDLTGSASLAAVDPLIGAIADVDAEARLNASAGLSVLGMNLRDEAAAARARSALQEYRERGGA
jgi:hypothetical protein